MRHLLSDGPAPAGIDELALKRTRHGLLIKRRRRLQAAGPALWSCTAERDLADFDAWSAAHPAAPEDPAVAELQAYVQDLHRRDRLPAIALGPWLAFDGARRVRRTRGSVGSAVALRLGGYVGVLELRPRLRLRMLRVLR